MLDPARDTDPDCLRAPVVELVGGQVGSWRRRPPTPWAYRENPTELELAVEIPREFTRSSHSGVPICLATESGIRLSAESPVAAGRFACPHVRNLSDRPMTAARLSGDFGPAAVSHFCPSFLET
jgi:hypothetical protein